MNHLIDVPVTTVVSLSAERAVLVVRAILRAECGYAKLSPTALTISDRLSVADGGIDAEVNASTEAHVPEDCLLRPGLSGFQIKSGTSFKPWTNSSIRGELIDRNGRLFSEVARLVERNGCYVLICTGHDLTPQQRNDARIQIINVLAEVGVEDYENLIDVLGASQLAEFAERYPGTASLLAIDPIQEAWTLDEWQRDAHMSNEFEASAVQTLLIDQIRAGLQGDAKHLRILGEPGVGKTRIVLEAVRAPYIEPFVLYLQHGAKFGQTALFRQLLKAGWEKPLILILDDLPEAELSDVWRHLKTRCGSLKIVSLDHGRDETQDEDIQRLDAPRLGDRTIRTILATRVGESNELDRWVAICEGSPRVAHAVADNLHSNPADLLRPPATVPLWARFLHGYGGRDDSASRQVDCVAQHLALFSRFGYEDPVADEAEYISRLIQAVDPTIGWARFQEIVQNLRARRVLQGSRTLFFVPMALHIYLWKQFWKRYGAGFDFSLTFNAMPASLHAWFLNNFRYATGPETAQVIDDILRPSGVFADRETLCSATGSRFLATLAEANPGAVLRLLEATVGTWTDQELLEFKQDRQNIVWTLEKIAVWTPSTVRALRVLARLAINENADFSNNATGTLVGLFRIGPEAAATEAPPEQRLPALLSLLKGSSNAERSLGLKAAVAALETNGLACRIVGPEYQGLKERAKLWIPSTYGDWWQAHLVFFQTLIRETTSWPSSQRPAVCAALLEIVEHQIRTPPCTELAFQVLDSLVVDSAMAPGRLNQFFWHWREHGEDDEHKDIALRLRNIARRYAQRDLSSRVQRYVIDVEWLEWEEDFRESKDMPKSRAKALVTALARRIGGNSERLLEIERLLAPASHSPALWHFGEQLALSDESRALLPVLVRFAQESGQQVCLHGYLSGVRTQEAGLYDRWMRGMLEDSVTAQVGADMALRSDYVDELFLLCLDALEARWIAPASFGALRFGKSMDSVPLDRAARLFKLLRDVDTADALHLVIELFESIAFDDTFLCDPEFVFEVVLQTIPGTTGCRQMSAHYWKRVCSKLVQWSPRHAMPLLTALLVAMRETYRLSYDSDVVGLAGQLVRVDPRGAWDVVAHQFELTLPKWRSDLHGWLQGGLRSFDEKTPRGAIADLPEASILSWIDRDVDQRAALIAHAVPPSLDDDVGGYLTRSLLTRYAQIPGVRSGISSAFHSGGWSGPASAHSRRKREMLRRWLASGFEFEVIQWIEAEIERIDREIIREEIDEERSRFE